MKSVRLITALLLLATLLGCLSACGGCNRTPTPPDDKTEEKTEPNTGGSAEVDEKEAYRPQKEDMDNYKFRMLLDSGLGVHKKYYTFEEDSGKRTVLDDAFFSRNTYVEDLYNIQIEVKVLEGDSQYGLGTGGYLNQQVLTNTDFADVIFAVAQNIMKDAIAGGRVMDLRQSKSINFDASYWDQRIQSAYAINGKLYTLEGDYSFYDELCTYVTFYSAKLWGEYNYYEKYGQPYDLVIDRKWTLDTMLEMIKDTSDVPLGTYPTQKNRVGALVECPLPYIFYLGSGRTTITHDDDGELKLMFSDTAAKQTAEHILSDVLRRVIGNREVLIIDAARSKGGLDKEFGTAMKMFGNNQSLFYIPTLLSATWVEMDKDTVMGILPIPLYDKNQESYYSWTSSQSHLPMMIPVTARKNFERITQIMETLCYSSRYTDSSGMTVYEAQYEWFVDRKLTQTPKDREVLELLFAERTYDLDFAMYITGVTSEVSYNFARERKTEGLYTVLSSLQGAAEARLDDFLKDWKANAKD